MKDDFNDLENINIEEGNIAENNDETSSNSFLKIDPIKNLDISNIKVETETKIEEPKKSPDKQTKEDIPQNDKPVKDNSKIIKIGIAALIVILCLVGGYFAYSKFMASDESQEFAENTVTEEVNNSAAQEIQVVEPVAENFQETVKEIQELESVSEEATTEENNIQVNDDNYDLVVLDKVYDEVINRGNQAYLNNFSSDELAIIRNTLYAKNGYKFKKKEYQEYFGEKSWYNPTTSSQNILTKNEEKLANIIKRYE